MYTYNSFSPVARFNYFIVSNKGKSAVILFANNYWLPWPVKFNSISAGPGILLSIDSNRYNLFNWHVFKLVSGLLDIFFLKYIRFLFIGKGYRLVINKKKTVSFNFGHSHIFYVYHYEQIPILHIKTKGIILGLNSFILVRAKNTLSLTKPVNIFTGRGLKFRKQFIRKKNGKISMYM